MIPCGLIVETHDGWAAGPVDEVVGRRVAISCIKGADDPDAKVLGIDTVRGSKSPFERIFG